jgi:hypothetical protein
MRTIEGFLTGLGTTEPLPETVVSGTLTMEIATMDVLNGRGINHR